MRGRKSCLTGGVGAWGGGVDILYVTNRGAIRRWMASPASFYSSCFFFCEGDQLLRIEAEVDAHTEATRGCTQ